MTTGKAKVSHFTANNKTELTVHEIDQPTVSFLCDAVSRPSANLSLQKQNNGTFFNATDDVKTGGNDSNRSQITYNMTPARCEDTGVFVCKADNGFPQPDEKTVRLNVSCE